MARFPRPWLGALLVLAVPAARVPAGAGNVVAEIDKAGALHLEGDDLANDVQVGRDPATREFVVRGRNGTTVNGVEEVRLPFTQSISANLGGGDDHLALGGFRMRKTLVADLGDGADLLTATNLIVGRRATVRGGPGDDLVAFEGRSDLRGGARLLTEDGADTVRIADSYVRGALRVVTGNDHDQIAIQRCGLTKRASVYVSSGEGDDFVELRGITCQAGGRVLTWGGADRVSVMSSRFLHDFAIDAGAADDDVTVDQSTFDEKFRVYGGEGTNRVFVGAAVISGGVVAAGGHGHSGNFYWWFVVINVY